MLLRLFGFGLSLISVVIAAGTIAFRGLAAVARVFERVIFEPITAPVWELAGLDGTDNRRADRPRAASFRSRLLARTDHRGPLASFSLSPALT